MASGRRPEEVAPLGSMAMTAHGRSAWQASLHMRKLRLREAELLTVQASQFRGAGARTHTSLPDSRAYTF